jgi:polar amino acid transport system substrate-binding protein
MPNRRYNMSWIQKSLITISLLCFSSIAFSDNSKVATVATLSDYSPYCFLKDKLSEGSDEHITPGKDSKKLQGYSWDILRESLHASGYAIDLKIYPWVRAIDETKRGNVDVIFPAGLTKERQTFFHFSKTPVNQANFLVYVQKDSNIRWDGLTSLAGLNIGAMRGWNYGQKFEEKKLKPKMISKIIKGFQMLEAGRIDGFVGYEVNFDYALKQSKLQPGNYKKLPAFDFSKEFLAGSKDNPKVQQILADYDKGKDIIDNNGVMDKIKIKWR